MPLPNNRRSVSVGNNVFENLYVYGDCEFDKDVTINGQLKYDELSLVRLTVTDKITAGIVTATTYYGDGSNITGIGSLTAAVEQTDYSCTNPITTLGNTIKISEDSNAYGTRYVESGTPSPSQGCDGDIWYSTTGTFLGSVPTGAVFHFAASTPPTGYLKCNGDTVPNGSGTVQGITADFSDLYTILGSTYGSAGQLPDLRGEFLRGWDDSRGVDSGRGFGSSQTDDFESHSHRVGSRDSLTDYGTSGAVEFVWSYPSPVGQYVNSQSVGGDETRPRNIALLACIKY